VWTKGTEEELLRINSIATAQMEPVQPLLQHGSVVKALVSFHFIQEEDKSLGPAGVSRSVLRTLLRFRSGVLALGEDFPRSNDAFWAEEHFPSFANNKLAGHAPFYCRIFAPEEPKRVLLLFHVSFVRGDDLANEAETLRLLMPETAIVLPEAPTSWARSLLSHVPCEIFAKETVEASR